MPKTLLVPVDGSDLAGSALPVASQLAERLRAELVLVSAQFGHASASEKYLEVAAAFTDRSGVRVEMVESVSLADALRAVAEDSNDPAICMATHARGRMGHALFGSLAEDVVRTLKVPAVLLGPRCATTLRAEGALAVCLDGSEASSSILPFAERWARALRTRVVLVHVVYPSDVGMPGRYEAEIQAAAQQLRRSAEVEVRAIPGESARSVISAVQDVDPLLVALATHGRTGLARVVLGSVATAVVRDTQYPALVVRPPTDVLTVRG